MPDNRSMSEKVRTLQATDEDLDYYYDEMQKIIPEILRALDEKQKLESDLEARTILAGTFLDARIQQLESDNEALRVENAGLIRTSTEEIFQSLADSERYRATIVQLEKERAEAVERVRVLEAEVRAAEKYRSETGSW